MNVNVLIQRITYIACGYSKCKVHTTASSDPKEHMQEIQKECKGIHAFDDTTTVRQHNATVILVHRNKKTGQCPSDFPCVISHKQETIFAIVNVEWKVRVCRWMTCFLQHIIVIIYTKREKR